MASLTINDIEKTELGPVWVTNQTAGPDRSNISIPIKKSNDEVTQVTIYMSFVPQNLTEQVNKADLIRSDRFRQALSLGLIELVTEDDAKQMLREKGADKERERIRNMRMSSTQLKPVEMQDDIAAMESKVSNPVKAFIETMDNSTETEVLNTTRNLGKLNNDDLKAIYSKAKKLRFSSVVDYCRKNKQPE